MAFVPRLTEPSRSDKRWINVNYGGYNYCIVRDSTGNVLPNCTGYVHGRWMEIGNTNTDYSQTYGLCLGNAGEYYGHSDSLQRSQEPQLGAIICFSSSGAGHVAVVEEIISENEIVCSESNYSHEYFICRHRYRQYGWNPSASSAWGTTFQGFILHPNISQGYSVAITNGSPASYTGNEGSTIAITANAAPAGMKFYYWKLTGSGSIANIYASSTTFTVGAGDAQLEAVYRKRMDSNNIALYYIAPFIKNNEIR